MPNPDDPRELLTALLQSFPRGAIGSVHKPGTAQADQLLVFARVEIPMRLWDRCCRATRPPTEGCNEDATPADPLHVTPRVRTH